MIQARGPKNRHSRAIVSPSTDDSSEVVPSIKFPSLFKPRTGDPIAHRTTNPVRYIRSNEDPAQQKLWSTDIDPRVAAICDQVDEDEPPDVVPEKDRAMVAECQGLPEFYAEWVEPIELDKVARGTLAKGTIDKTKQSLRRWVRFTWPANYKGNWQGPPVGRITNKWLRIFRDAALKEHATSTVASSLCHIRQVLRLAVQFQVRSTLPKCDAVTVEGSGERYLFEQLNIVYGALGHQPELQSAFVVAVNAGPRPIDLFNLKWSNVAFEDAVPAIDFVSEKTGKRQRVPLAPVTLAHLLRLKPGRPEEPVFRRWFSPAADQGRSYRARKRCSIMKAALALTGLDFRCPFQAARATCNQRLEDYRTGVGQFVLGHGLGLNARHYYEPSDLIREAILGIHQPESFLVTLKRLRDDGLKLKSYTPGPV